MKSVSFIGRYGPDTPDPSDICILDLPPMEPGKPVLLRDEDAARLDAAAPAGWFTFEDPTPAPDPAPAKRGKAAPTDTTTTDAPAAPAEEAS